MQAVRSQGRVAFWGSERNCTLVIVASLPNATELGSVIDLSLLVEAAGLLVEAAARQRSKPMRHLGPDPAALGLVNQSRELKSLPAFQTAIIEFSQETCFG